jgi:hypothetical protein
MKGPRKAADSSKGRKKIIWFWLTLIIAVIFTITGLLLGDLYEAYQTAATL